MTKARNMDFTISQRLLQTSLSQLNTKGTFDKKTVCCVTVVACYIKGLYKIREYTMNKKT